MIHFECHHVLETIRKRKRKFLQKFRMSSNELCVIFRDKATADLELQKLSVVVYHRIYMFVYNYVSFLATSW